MLFVLTIRVRNDPSAIRPASPNSIIRPGCPNSIFCDGACSNGTSAVQRRIRNRFFLQTSISVRVTYRSPARKRNLLKFGSALVEPTELIFLNCVRVGEGQRARHQPPD